MRNDRRAAEKAKKREEYEKLRADGLAMPDLAGVIGNVARCVSIIILSFRLTAREKEFNFWC